MKPKLPRNVILLGVVSLLTDTATEMVMPLLPIFLTTVVGAGALALGWIEGLAEATASVLKLVSGRWADRMGRNRPLVIAGYSISSTLRPLIALATAAWHVLAVRVLDRVGKGLRTSPRDALIAASTAEEHRGAAFGVHRAMDHVGAVVGPALAAAVLAFWSDDLRHLFWLTAIPGAAAVTVLALGVREAPAASTSAHAAEPAPADERARLKRLLMVFGLFTLGNASDVFLLLKAGASRTPLATLPLLWMALHVVKALVSVPGGRLADRWGRRKTVALGWSVYVAVYVAFAFVSSPWAIAALFVVYGAYHGLTEGAEKAMVAELAPTTKRGASFGWYHLTLGLAALVANLGFGGLWQAFGSRVAFLTSAGLALMALALLGLLAPRRSR